MSFRLLLLQVAELERSLRERDAQMEALNASMDEARACMHGGPAALLAPLLPQQLQPVTLWPACLLAFGCSAGRACTPTPAVPAAVPVLGALLQVGEEVRVLVAEGLRPADLIQELLLLR